MKGVVAMATAVRHRSLLLAKVTYWGKGGVGGECTTPASDWDEWICGRGLVDQQLIALAMDVAPPIGSLINQPVAKKLPSGCLWVHLSSATGWQHSRQVFGSDRVFFFFFIQKVLAGHGRTDREG